MRNKTKRLAAIREIIEKEFINTQDDLLERLRERGIEATQSTLSRDMRLMRIARVADSEKGYVYVVPRTINEQKEEKVSSVITDSIIGIDFSNNIAVIKTLPGYANAVTVLIDNEKYYEVLGTVAGEDTIIIVMREGVEPKALLHALHYIIPKIDELPRW
ncbi:MAG: arginine repressor [Culturomica sp.]|jgi:transcriptional regulator of arginine metabolism|nr:arginine repressor [Culturomica sp.]